jgi:chromosome partitioning protein
MKVISVVNHKGGVGKSTISLNLAQCFSSDLKVALIDSDVQGSISNMANVVDPLSIPIIPISELNDKAHSSYDILIVDTPPYHTNQLVSVIRASDFVLIPVKPSYFDVLAVKPTITLIEQIQVDSKHIKGALLLNMVKHRESINVEIRQILAQYNIPTLNSSLTERISYRRSPLSTEGVFSLDDNKAKLEVTELADEILTMMGL